MEEEKMYGLCAEGHLHAIRSQFLNIVSDPCKALKSNFESYMFDDKKINEKEITSTEFVPLTPVNCPASPILVFDDETLPYRQDSYLLRKALSMCDDEVKPFKIEDEDRSPMVFLLEFERNTNRLIETKAASKLVLYTLIKKVIDLSDFEVKEMSYEMLREEFLSQRWSISYQKKLREDFLRGRYPQFRGQKVVDYVIGWNKKFVYNTIFLSQEYVSCLINRLPIRYGFQLTKYLNGGSYGDILTTVLNCSSDVKLIKNKDVSGSSKKRKL